ncbi:hypothetical protein nbrc107696_28220 [Gordonia spumicola]|uniref:Uncharacterized protein n=1 Tax=Gordonia spumicola TaxID=589161 RepID=A0A7I9VAG7_9ACTN|nr:hypothetical protein [Gordonia spumicola]GEE02376.1 hypothetical protein nbrc107696_28220 [Gordonia spumicola]
MTKATRVGAVAGAVVALAVGAGAVAGPAHAAPVAVQQFPANGIISNGITAFGTYSASIRIETAGAGAVWLSAPGGRQCGNPAVDDSFVRFTYTNISNGRSGAGTVRPCPGPWSGSQKVKLTPGAGTVVGTIAIVSKGGPWSIPGGATFGVR